MSTPKQNTGRVTRSNSQSHSSITLRDIENLINSSKNELLSEIKKETEKIHDHLNSLTSRVDDFEKMLHSLRSNQNRQDTEIQDIRESLNKLSCCKAMTDDEICNEIALRMKKKNFLIIAGIPESTSGSIVDRRTSDTETIQRVAGLLGVTNLDVEEVSRIGRIDSRRPRLLRFKCNNENQRVSILKQAKVLNKTVDHNTVYIFPDRTLFQRQKERKLREEFLSKKSAGFDVIIRNGCIVQKDTLGLSTQNFP